MHEDIMRFPSRWFYNGCWRLPPTCAHRGILDLDTPIDWIDTTGKDFKEQFVGESFGVSTATRRTCCSTSWRHTSAASAAGASWRSASTSASSRPTRHRCSICAHACARNAALRPYRDLLTVNTVDGFQGQERDVIFISLVRANADGQIGFLGEPPPYEHGHHARQDEAFLVRYLLYVRRQTKSANSIFPYHALYRKCLHHQCCTDMARTPEK